MKKTVVILLALMLSAGLIMPAMAQNGNGNSNGEKNKNKQEQKQENEQKKAEQKKEIEQKKAEQKQEKERKAQENKKKEIEKEIAKVLNRPAVVRATLKEIRLVATVSSTAELVVSVKAISPSKNKKWLAYYPVFYPELKKDLVVKITNKTRFVRRFNGKSALEELAVGDDLQITGKFQGGSYFATVVKDESIQLTMRVHNGLIDSLDAVNSTFVLKQNNNKSVTVKVGAKTKLVVPGVASPTFADLKVGDKVHARGVLNRKTQSIDASLVRVSVVVIPTPVPVVPTTTTSTTP